MTRTILIALLGCGASSSGGPPPDTALSEEDRASLVAMSSDELVELLGCFWMTSGGASGSREAAIWVEGNPTPREIDTEWELSESSEPPLPPARFEASLMTDTSGDQMRCRPVQFGLVVSGRVERTSFRRTVASCNEIQPTMDDPHRAGCDGKAFRLEITQDALLVFEDEREIARLPAPTQAQ